MELCSHAIVGQKSYWSINDYESADEIFPSVTRDDNFTIFIDNADQIKRIYLSRDENCERITIRTTILKRRNHWILVKMKDTLEKDQLLFICTDPEMDFSFHRAIKYDSSTKEDTWMTLIIFYVACICLSFVFSGLNLALLSLDVETLEMIRRYDEDPTLRRYAEDVIPIRRDTNLMICTIILGNTLCNVTSTLIFGVLTGNLVAPGWQHSLLIVIVPTTVLLIFGEIMPQIVFTKFALAFGARLKMVMQFFTFIMFPLSKPLSWTLDFFVGSEKVKSSAVREIARFAVHKDKMAIIANNTLDLRRKLAKDVMTPLSQVKMLSDSDILNANLRKKTITHTGHTRMPVYRGNDSTNIIGVLNVKDLFLLDNSDYTTVGSVLQLWPRDSSCRFVSGDTPVPQLMSTLRNNATMVIVSEFVLHEKRNMPTGIVTLEDLLEEIVGEIYDEKDRQKMTDDKGPLNEKGKGKLRKKKKEISKSRQERQVTNRSSRLARL